MYETVILDAYGVWRRERELTAEEVAEIGQERLAACYVPVAIVYAAVPKERQGGRVAAVTQRLVLGSEEQLQEALAAAACSATVTTRFVARWHGPRRQFNARPKRKAYTWSKDLSLHEACTRLVGVWYNFGWCVRTRRTQVHEEPPRYR